MKWLDIFHGLVVPFLGGLALTILKLIADQEVLSFDQSNDIALDMVMLGIGLLGAFFIVGRTVEITVDAGVGDAFLAAILLYLRYRRKRLAMDSAREVQPVGALAGFTQLILGVASVIWVIKAF